MSTESRVITPITHGVEFLDRLLAEGSVAAWNNWIKAVTTTLSWNPLAPGWVEGESPPAISIDLNFAGADLSGRSLDGIFLGYAWMEGANFSHSSLRRAVIASVPRGSFRDADLRNADMSFSEITATDFSGAQIEGINLDRAMFEPDEPPVGLPAEMVERIWRRDPLRWQREQEKM